MWERARLLEQQLFILDTRLRAPLLTIRGKSYQILFYELLRINLDSIKSIQDFYSDQEKQR
jgi:hypothetical protein